ncbi:MAG: hypothetical protein ACE5JN_06425 [Candidatus Methylomirabilia bacterium]
MARRVDALYRMDLHRVTAAINTGAGLEIPEDQSTFDTWGAP